MVFAHASLEEFLRSVAAALLPLSTAEALNKIPLKGLGKTQATKFLLGDLVPHRESRVAELLEDSVVEHLERKTFNSTDEVATLLNAVGIPLRESIGADGSSIEQPRLIPRGPWP